MNNSLAKSSMAFVVSFLLVTVVFTTNAAAILVQTPTIKGLLIYSDFDRPEQLADDIMSDEDTVLNFVRWRGYYPFSTPGNEPVDDFTIRFFANLPGDLPAVNPFAEFNVGNVGRVNTGLDTIEGGFDIFQYEAVFPDVALNAGETIWLSIVNNTATDDAVDWAWGSEIGGPAAFRLLDGQRWNNKAVASWFQFNPEPASITILGVGLGALAFAARRRRAKVVPTSA